MHAHGSIWEDGDLSSPRLAPFLHPSHCEGTVAIRRDAESSQAFWRHAEFKGGAGGNLQEVL